MRRFHEALLLALFLLAVQTAIVAHDHGAGTGTAPFGAVAQNCEFCTGHSAAAPAPERGSAARHEPQSLRLPRLADDPVLPAPVAAAHRSRAPPSFRSS